MKSRRIYSKHLVVLVMMVLASLAAALAYSWKQPGSELANKPQISSPDNHSTSTPALLQSDRPTRAQVSEAYGKLPLSFEANQGQTDADVRFLARGAGYGLFLTPTEAVLSLPRSQAVAKCGRSNLPASYTGNEDSSRGSVLRMRLVGANTQSRVSGVEELPGKSNYFIGNDPEQWRRDVRSYAKVRYEAVYPSVDLIYYGNQRRLEYDFVVAPGADPEAITMTFDGIEKLEVDAQGELVLNTANGQVRQHRPVIYQEISGVRQEISGGYALKGPREVGFHIAAYDEARPLVIDPVLEYSTYLGGNSIDEGASITVDSAGNAYVTGFTISPDFPRKNASQAGYGNGQNAFITKLDPTGSRLVYSTYLGGRSQATNADCVSLWAQFFHGFKNLLHDITLANCDLEEGIDVAVDTAGNAYITGVTISPDFPTVNPLQANLGGGNCGLAPCADAFVVKLNPGGSDLIYSTYLGGSDFDVGLGIAADAAGNAYVTGGTFSSNFPTANPMQVALNGAADGFIAKLNPGGSALVYSTYLGGSSGGAQRGVIDDAGVDIAVDNAGNAYVTGATLSPDFPTVNPLQPTLTGGGGFGADAFVAKLNSSGSALVYSTYLGGFGGDVAFAIAVDAAGQAYVTGQANSSGFPTVNPLQAASGGGGDAFVAKLNPSGSALVYSTYLGGNDLDQGMGIAVDAAGNAYVVGFTWSSNFSTVNPVQAVSGGLSDAFVVKINSSGSALVYSTYLGGSVFDEGEAIAVDAAGNAYVTGGTTSPDFPTANPFQAALGGGLFSDAFVAKLR